MAISKGMPGEARGYYLPGPHIEDARIYWLTAVPMNSPVDPVGSPRRARRD